MMRLLVTGYLVCVSAPAIAHDFWIEVDRPVVAEKTAVLQARFKIGSADKPEDWNARRERIVALRSVGPDGVRDQQAEIVPGEPGSATIRLSGEGSHVVMLESTPSEIELTAAEFNDYLEHEGLSTIRDWRAKNGQNDKPGRELYARRAKAIVQLGGKPTDTVSTPLGLGLEIVPERNPLALKAGEKLPVRLYFRGAPLTGAKLVCEAINPAGLSLSVTSDVDGRALFAIPRHGQWKIATVWSAPISGNPRADFDTLFASLTFGY
jgi:uncharacterized GH25 family protein